MVQDASGFDYAPSRVDLTSIAGLDLLMRVMRKLGIPRTIRRLVRVKKIRYGFTEDQHLIPLVLNIALGRSDLNDIQWLAKEKKLLKGILGYAKLPKERALANHLAQYGDEALAAIKSITASVISPDQLSSEPAMTGLPALIPLDVDPSIFEQYAPKREKAETTYDGRLCYTPAFAFLGRERYVLHHQLQAGREKVVETIDAFLKSCFDRLPDGIDRKSILARFDSGLYSGKTVASCEEAGVWYLVKARSSAPLDAHIGEELQADRAEIVPKPWGGEFYGEFAYAPKEWGDPRRFVFCAQIKTQEENGQQLLIEDVRYQVLVTNLPASGTPRAAFDLYRRRGAAEEPIKEIKHDLDLEQLPSQSFRVNEVFLAAGLLAYNLLVLLGRQWRDPQAKPRKNADGPVTLFRRRIKTLQDVLLRSAATVVAPARRSLLRVTKWWLERVDLDGILQRIQSLAPVPI